jgi:hypothetical protein
MFLGPICRLPSNLSGHRLKVCRRLNKFWQDFRRLFLLVNVMNSNPDLQLQPVFNIYFCKRPVNHGIRFYFLVLYFLFYI